MPIPACLSDVEPSVTGRRWIGPSAEHDRLGQAIAQATGAAGDRRPHPGAARASRPAEAAAYLAPALRDLMPDPSRLRDMDRRRRALPARRRSAASASRSSPTTTSTAAPRRRCCSPGCARMGRSATLYVPDRIEEGYGPNVPAMRRLGAAHDLIVCVDCGTLSHEPIAAAGCDVIVLDHHLGGETLPPALAVVNPNRQDEDGALGHLCAAGVVFLMLVAVNRLMRAEGARRARPPGAARPRGARHRRRRGAARRAQPRAGPPGARGDGAAARGPASPRWPTSAGLSGAPTHLRARLRRSGRGSTPAGGSARPTSARGSSPPTTRTRRRRWPSGCTR